MLDLTKVGSAVAICRQDKGYTQEQLASRLGVTPQAVSKWERGISLPDTEMLPGISKMLEISIDELLTGAPFEKESADEPDTPWNPTLAKTLLKACDIELHISLSLCVDKSFIDNLYERITLLRRTLAFELGIIMPPVTLRDDISLYTGEESPKGRYSIRLRRKEYGGGFVYRGLKFVISDDAAPGGIAGTEPLLGEKGFWLTEDEQKAAGDLQYIDGANMIGTHLQDIITKNIEVVVTRQMVKHITDILAEEHQTLVSEVVPARLSYGNLREILVGVLNAGKPVNDMVTILETIDRRLDDNDGAAGVYAQRREDMIKEIISAL